jgi:hypothetical protein
VAVAATVLAVVAMAVVVVALLSTSRFLDLTVVVIFFLMGRAHRVLRNVLDLLNHFFNWVDQQVVIRFCRDRCRNH